MVNEKQIKQLVIDRSQSQNSSKRPLILTVTVALLICAASFYWLTSPVIAVPTHTSASELTAIETESVAKAKLASTYTEQSIENTDIHNSPVLNIKKTPPLDSVLDASGHVVARRIATVSSRVTGKLEKLNIEEGVEVKKSQILAELDDKQAQISYQLALAELSAQQAHYEEAQVMQKYALQKSLRNAQLVKEKLISIQLNEDSQLKAEQINAQLKNKKALVALAQQKAELALYQLEQHKIRAPFDGVVISKNAQVGELISSGSSSGGFIRTGVGTIVDMNSLEIEVEVGESYINRVYAGQKVISTLDAYPQWEIKSEVIAVIPTADRQKASIKVRVKLFDIDQRILPDMGVKVSFLAARAASL